MIRARDEEDVGTDLDFSKYTRDRVDYESGGNTRDLWAAIYRPRSARINANYGAQLSKSRGSPEVRASVEEESSPPPRALVLAQTPRRAR